MRARAAKHDATLAAWMSALGEGGDVDARLVEAAADVVQTLFERPTALAGAVRRFGGLLGSDGWPLESVAHWLAELHPHVTRRRRALLTTRAASTSLAAGWADAFVRGAGSDRCIVPVTALGTALVLRLRINEVYAQCHSLEVHVADAFRLVVIDADMDDLGPFDRDAVMVTMASICCDVFRAGETIVRCSNRIVVLTGVSSGSELCEAVLAKRLADAPLVRVTQPVVWNDRLPASAADVDRYLGELVS